MALLKPLAPGAIIENSDICDIFACSPQGGMRRSLKTNSLVLTSDPAKLYNDRWEGAVLHYTGMGQTGDQTLTGNQNRTLAESRGNGVEVYLFEQLGKNRYLFQGLVELAGHPYEESQADSTGASRRVWMFPLRLVGRNEPIPLPVEVTTKRTDQGEREARRASTAELLARLKGRPKKPGVRPTSVKQFDRSPEVVELAKRRARGNCELCTKPAPFEKLNPREPYLEVHHIVWLAKGGEDTVENTVALCPNCHRKMHALGLAADIKILQVRSRMAIPELGSTSEKRP